MIKIKTAMLAEALDKHLASSTRAANNTKNTMIRQCHEQTAKELAAIIAQLPTDAASEMYITQIEPTPPTAARSR